MISRISIAGKFMRHVLALLLAWMTMLSAVVDTAVADCKPSHQLPAQMISETVDDKKVATHHTASMPEADASHQAESNAEHRHQNGDGDIDYTGLCHIGFTGCAGCTFPVQEIAQPGNSVDIHFHLAHIDGHSIDMDAHLRPPRAIL